MKKNTIWIILYSIIFSIMSITKIYWADIPCLAWDLFWQQQYIPHFTGSIPTASQIWSFLFPVYKQNIVENISLCGIMNTNTILTSNNTYAYCKNGVLKDLIGYNISWIEQNLDTTAYRHTQCQQIKNTDCTINNTTIKDTQSLIFFESSSSISWICRSESRTCNNWVLSWSYYHTSCTNHNGLCGTSHGISSINAPTLNLCRAGIQSQTTPVFDIFTHRWTWICQWAQWNSETCTANKAVESQWPGQCKTYPWWATTLRAESQFLCTLWSGINFNETTLWRTWTCVSDYGNSPQCSTKKSLIATWTIIYTTNRDNSITASVTNIFPYWTYIVNNNNSNSKRFTQNGTFNFQLKFNDTITDIKAQVTTINNRTIKIQDLILDYKNNRCALQRDITINGSKQYNLLDVQTMVNHCLLEPTITKKWYTLNMKKNITRWEFIKSAYNFIQTIRPYTTTSYTINANSYKGVPNQPRDEEAIKWLLTIKWDQYINHTTSRGTATYKRNSSVTTKEIYDLMTYILNIHDDNDIYFTSLWEREKIYKNMKREQYANIIRKTLEQYDRVALGNNILFLEQLHNQTNWLSTINQNNTLQEIYSRLYIKDPISLEKAWLSKRSLLHNISTIINNETDNKKTIFSVSFQEIIRRTETNMTTTKKEREKTLFTKMSY